MVLEKQQEDTSGRHGTAMGTSYSLTSLPACQGLEKSSKECGSGQGVVNHTYAAQPWGPPIFPRMKSACADARREPGSGSCGNMCLELRWLKKRQGSPEKEATTMICINIWKQHFPMGTKQGSGLESPILNMR